MKYEIYPLLKYEVSENGLSRSGPFSPVCAANEMGKELELDFHHLARVNYDDNRILQVNERPEGFTSYDQLVLVKQQKNVIIFFYFVDMGTDYCPAAFYFSNDDEVGFTTVFENTEFEIKPTKEDFLELFKYMVDNPNTFIHSSFTEIKEARMKSKANGAKEEI